MGSNLPTLIKANVSINFNGEAKVGFSIKGKHYKVEIPDFDTDFHDFDLVNEDLDGKHYEGVLDQDKIEGLYEFDSTQPDLTDLISKLNKSSSKLS